MSNILFVSESEIPNELELAKREILEDGFTISGPVQYNKAIFILKNTAFDIVLINAKDNKLNAYELVADLKQNFRNSMQVIVYLPGSNSCEGSKFGKYNADVEDENSIKNVRDRLVQKAQKHFSIDENIYSFVSIDGALGCSSMAILLAKYFNQMNKSALLLESNNKFSIKNMLNLETQHALLSRDKSKELNQIKDFEWFSSFLNKSKLLDKTFYLHLFHSLTERQEFLESSSKILDELVKQFDLFTNSFDKDADTKSLKIGLFDLSNKLKLVCKELNGSSYSLFEELVQLGSQYSQNIIMDLSNDISTSLNKQLLSFSKYIIVVFTDSIDAKTNFLNHKKHLESKYKADIIPVLVCDEFNYSKYKKLDTEAWDTVLGRKPVLCPKDFSAFLGFIYDQRKLKTSSKLFRFSEELAQRIAGEQFSSKKNSGVLKLLNV